MYNEERICGKCYWHRREQGDWSCQNEDSECCGDYTDYEDTCDCWGERE